jgi:hypothetical protein
MSWVTLTAQHLRDRLSDAELSAIERAAQDIDGRKLGESVRNVTAKVRGYVAAHASNTMGPAGTIPETLVGAALDLLIVEHSTRCGGALLDPRGLRKEAAERATELLKDVARGTFAVEDPEPADGEQAEQRSHAGPAVEEPESVM